MNKITNYTIGTIKSDNVNVVERSKDNKNVLKINVNEKQIYIGSKYSVNRDIDKFINEIGDIDINTSIIIFGLGAGEHIREVVNKFNNSISILVIEPDISTLNLICCSDYYDDIVKNDKIAILHYKNMEAVLKEFIDPFKLQNTKVIFFGNYKAIYDNESVEFLKLIKTIITYKLVDRNTSINLSKEIIKNSIKNLDYVAKSFSINKLKDIYKDIPAIVVSAGPSLAKNIHLLKKVQDEFIIITGGRTLEPLLNEGIKPDFLCVIDPFPRSFQLVENNLRDDIPLVYYEGTNSDVVDKHEGDKIFYTIDNVLKKHLNEDITSLAYGGSVAHTCTALALHFGCDPIIFMGQDLAYTDEKSHADIAKHNSNNLLNKSECDLYVEDIYGEKIRTSMSLNFMRLQFEEVIKIFNKNTFINATEGGANINGTSIASLNEVIDKYKPKCKKKIHYSKKVKKVENSIDIMKNLNECINNIEELQKCCDEVLKHNKELYYNYKKGNTFKVDKAINRISRINNSIEKKIENTLFIEGLFYTIQSEVGSKEFLYSPIDDEKIKVEKMYKQINFIYNEMKNCLAEVLLLIKKEYF
ncbi:motility associated factor glycosyltransferase family protein [Clostridium sp. Marseille-QA1073]